MERSFTTNVEFAKNWGKKINNCHFSFMDDVGCAFDLQTLCENRWSNSGYTNITSLHSRCSRSEQLLLLQQQFFFLVPHLSPPSRIDQVTAGLRQTYCHAVACMHKHSAWDLQCAIHFTNRNVTLTGRFQVLLVFSRSKPTQYNYSSIKTNFVPSTMVWGPWTQHIAPSTSVSTDVWWFCCIFCRVWSLLLDMSLDENRRIRCAHHEIYSQPQKNGKLIATSMKCRGGRAFHKHLVLHSLWSLNFSEKCLESFPLKICRPNFRAELGKFSSTPDIVIE